MTNEYEKMDKPDTGVGIAFEENRLLFYNEMMNRTSLLREMEMDFGVLPMPKADELQEEYGSFIHQNVSSTVVIPITVSDIERTGRILEDITRYSGEYLYPAYVETAIKSKYLRDEESAEMVDIVLNSIHFDLALLSVSPLMADLRTLLTNDSNTIASHFASKLESYNTKLAMAIEDMIS